jgi:hypothetical protein
MRYTLLLHYPEMTPEETGSDSWADGMRAFDEYAKALDADGVLVSAEVLQPSSASTTVSRRDGQLRVQDGPFADTKEQLGGTFVIDVADLDAALDWAGRAPSVDWGTVEVRPGATHFADGAWQGTPGR